MHPVFSVCLASMLAGWLLSAQPRDPVLLSFAVTGDLRIDPTHPEPLTASALPRDLLETFHKPGGAAPYPFYFNIVQLRRTLADLARIRGPRPRYLFLTGDLVNGFARDRGVLLREELKDFALAAKVPGGRLKVVPLPGNHEMTFKEFKGTKIYTGDDDADAVEWTRWVHANHFDALAGNGPGPDALDQLPEHSGHRLRADQSRITYSFKDGPVHFVVLNTDTATDLITDEGYETEGLLPLRWVQEDLDKAQADPAIQEIFLVGHKPVRPPANVPKPGPYDALNPAVAEPFRQLLVGHPKVVAYLCSHAHLWHVDSLADGAAANDVTTRPVQIVAGNGGVAFETFWHPEREAGRAWLPDETPGPFFGFTLLKVFRSGKVTYNSWQREPPSPYYGRYPDAAKAKARPRAEDTIIH